MRIARRQGHAELVWKVGVGRRQLAGDDLPASGTPEPDVGCDQGLANVMSRNAGMNAKQPVHDRATSGRTNPNVGPLELAGSMAAHRGDPFAARSDAAER